MNAPQKQAGVWRRAFIFSLRGMLAAVLLSSSIIHFSNPYYFLESVLEYEVISGGASWVAASLLMNAGLLAGIAIIVGFCRKGAFVISSAMFFCFVLVQSVALSRGLDIGCGCFGGMDHQIGIQTLAFASCCLGASLFLLRFDNLPPGRIYHA